MSLQGIAELLIQLISEHGVLAVMLGMVIEEVLVPVPSPIIPMAAGVLLVDAATFSGALIQILFFIAIPASIASVVSSYLVYGLAYWGGKPVLEKYGGYLDLEWEDIQKLEDHFISGRDHYYIAVFRALPVVPLSLVSGAAGVFRMNWKRYGFWSFWGMMVRNFSLAFLGWRLQDSFRAIASGIETVSTAVLVVAAGLAVLWVVQRNAGRVYRKIFEFLG